MPSLIRPLMIFGPSGSGKSTLVKKMLEEFPDKFGYSVSHTTRKPRPGEIHGIHYHFTDVETMKRAIEDGFFLESAVFSGNMYGTSKAAVDDIAKKGKESDEYNVAIRHFELTFESLVNTAQGKVCLLEIDVQGVKQVKKSDLNPFSIFIIPPSLDELKRRLLKRNTESEESLLQRLAKAEEEIKYGTVPGNCDLVICNDDFETAYSELRHFVVENVFKNQFNTNGSNL